MATVYDKVKERERAAKSAAAIADRKARRRERQAQRHLEDPEELRKTQLAAIRASFWLAAAGPALQREAAIKKMERDKALDVLCEAILTIEDALGEHDVLPFRINDECRWNGLRIVAAKGEHCTVLVKAPRAVRYQAIDDLAALDVTTLPRRSRP